MNPLFLLVNSRRGGILLVDSKFGAFFLALATPLRRHVLLYAHSKCVGSYSMRIHMAVAALFDHVGAYSNTTGLHDEQL
jgi:hypothetical protein